LVEADEPVVVGKEEGGRRGKKEADEKETIKKLVKTKIQGAPQF